MSIRLRTFTVILIAALLPLILLGVALRRTAGEGIVTLDEQRVDALVGVLDQRIRARDIELHDRLAALRDVAADDQGLALAVAGLRERAAWPEEFVALSRRLAGLDLLVLLGGDGHPIASAAADPAWTSEFDGRGVRGALRGVEGGLGLLSLGDALALVRLDSLRIAGELLTLIGGRAVTTTGLAELSGGDVSLSLVYHGGALSTDADLRDILEQAGQDRLSSPEFLVPQDVYLVRAVSFPRVRSATNAIRPTPLPLVPATLLLTHPLRGRDDLLAAIDLRFAAITVAAVLLAVLAATLLATRLTRPLRDLAGRAESLDLDHLDIDFPSESNDEVGTLASVLESMRIRLHNSVDRLRATERRALLGDLARQVNHDLRNGFLPIRNVIHHLDRVARDEPEKLPEVFLERERTLEMSLAYLEKLAVSWTRHAQQRDPVLHDVRATAAALADHYRGRLLVRTSEECLMVKADPVALRRILENLLRNAFDATAVGDAPDAAVHLELGRDDDGRVRLSVHDTGEGMTENEQARAFDMFHTTKPGGTGLGLSIVRRLVGDLGGELAMTSVKGAGTTVTVHVPAALEEVSP